MRSNEKIIRQDKLKEDEEIICHFYVESTTPATYKSKDLDEPCQVLPLSS